MTGAGGLDTFVVAAGDAVLTNSLGSAESAGSAGDGTAASASGFDVITDFAKSDGTIVSETLDVAGTAAVVADGIVDLTDAQAQLDTGAASTTRTIASMEVTDGVAVFNDADDHTGNDVVVDAVTLSAVIEALQDEDLGDAGASVGFAYDSDTDGTADSFMVFTQGVAAGTDASDTLVHLSDSGSATIDALITTNTAGANDLFIA